MNDYILRSERLTKKFKNKTVLKSIDLQVPSGKIYGLLGVNGAGKSTLMKIIVGIIVNYQGDLYFKDHKWTRKDLKLIGSLIEYPAAYENLTAFQNMEIIGLEEKSDLSNINDTLIQVGLDDTKKTKIKDFSMGMKQRLGIAMAMLKDPELLILDEPFNGLDPYGIEELKEFLRNLSSNGKTIMISSHILPELQDLADEIGIINEGKLVYQFPILENQNISDIFFRETHRRRL